MDEFGKFGMNDFFITLNNKGRMIKAYFSDHDLGYNIEFIEADLARMKTIKILPNDCRRVLHLAGQSSGEISFDDPVSDLNKNTVSTLNLINYSIKNKVERFVYASSMSVYGNSIKSKFIDEKNNPKPISVYGNSKLTAEKMLAVLFEHYRIPVVNLRLFNVYGPSQNLNNLQQGMVSIYIYYLLHKKKILVKGSLNRIRDFIFIDDVTNAINSIIKSRLYVNGTFNISSKTKTTVRNLIRLLQKNFKMKKDIVISKKTPGDVFGFGGILYFCYLKK